MSLCAASGEELVEAGLDGEARRDPDASKRFSRNSTLPTRRSQQGAISVAESSTVPADGMLGAAKPPRPSEEISRQLILIRNFGRSQHAYPARSHMPWSGCALSWTLREFPASIRAA
jgi:hypothetical protein